MKGHDSMFRMTNAEVEAAKKGFTPVNIPIGHLDMEGVRRTYVYTRLLDTDLAPITICRLINNGEDRLEDQYRQPGWPGTKIENLTAEKAERQQVATNICRLPKELVALVLDHPEIDLNDYLPAENDPDTVIVGFTGWSRSGKSTMLAILKFYSQESGDGLSDVFSFDRISNGSAEQYYQVLKNSPKVRECVEANRRGELSAIDLVGVMCEEIRESFSDGRLMEIEGGDEWTLNKALLNLLEKFKTGERRPQVILADMNGMRWQPEGVEQRPEHVFDVFQRDSITVTRVVRGVPEEKLRQVDVSPKEIYDYMVDLYNLEVGIVVEADARLKAAEFRSIVNGQFDPELEMCWEIYQNLRIHSQAIRQLARVSQDMLWVDF